MNDLAMRTLTGAILIVIALLAAHVGGDIFASLVALAATAPIAIPIATPAWEMRGAQPHLLITGASFARWLATLPRPKVTANRAPVRRSAIGQYCLRSGTSRSAPAPAKKTT